MAEIIEADPQVQRQVLCYLPIVLHKRSRLYHQHTRIETLRRATLLDVHDRSTLEVRVIDGEIDDIGEVKRRTVKASGEIIQVLLSINIDTDTNTVRSLDIGQYIMPVPVVVDPAGWTPGRKAFPKPPRIGIWQRWKRSGGSRLIPICANIRHAGFVQQLRRKAVNVVNLVIPGSIWTHISQIGPWIGNSPLGGVAEQAVEQLVISVVEVVVDPCVSLKSIVDGRLVDGYISQGDQISGNVRNGVGAYEGLLDLTDSLETAGRRTT
jgi:hypothetical protein